MQKKKSLEEIRQSAKRIRRMAVDMARIAGAKGAHLGGSLSSVEIFAVLYGCVLNYDINNPDDPNRDRLILGKEHGRLSEYPALFEAGYISKDEVFSYLENGIFVLQFGYGISYGSGDCFRCKTKRI